MAGSGLFALYKLHLIDSALYEMRQRSQALDLGRGEAEKIRELELDPEGVLVESRKLSVELKDLELEQKSLEDKIKKLDGDLYGGKIINPREIAAIEKDKGLVMEHRSKNDERILELWEILPPAKEIASHLEGEISKLKEMIAKKQAAAKIEHEKLQQAFKLKAAERPAALKDVPPALLEQYEKLRAKLDVGMAMVTDDHRCGSCGMHVPPKAFEFIIEDRVIQCENCRRILFRLQQS